MVLSFVCAMALAAGSAGVQPTPPPPSPPPGTTDAFLIRAMVLEDETAPVAVPEPSEQAMRYYRSGNVLWFVEQAWSIAVLVLLLATGLSASLRNGRPADRPQLVLHDRRLLRPLHDRHHGRRSAAQLLHGVRPPARLRTVEPDVRQVVGDTLKSLAVACIVGALVMWVPYLLLRKSPRRWWLYTAIALVPFIVARQSGRADLDRAALQQVRADAGQGARAADPVAGRTAPASKAAASIEVNKSVDTKTLNAYVAGLFGTKRIVLWDTIIEAHDDASCCS